LAQDIFIASVLLFLQSIKLTFAFRRAREFCTKGTGEILADVKSCESLNCNLRIVVVNRVIVTRQSCTVIASDKRLIRLLRCS